MDFSISNQPVSPEEETLETWNALATVYNERFMDITLYDQTYEAFVNEITSDMIGTIKVLDIGCGPGVVSKYLLDKMPCKLNITGIDSSPRMVEIARENFPNCNWSVLNCRDILSLERDGPFDAAVIGFCIPYLDDSNVDKLIDDVYHLLANNGVLYLSFVPGSPEQSEFKSNKSGQRVYFHYHEESRINQLLISHGFRVSNFFHVDFPRPENVNEIHAVILARKEL